ncbi:MAG: O-antigen ligase family protein [Vampirovibrionales bacterium]|nr:O-antigen ligase family protein [Vampirovibrionales bacterium]
MNSIARLRAMATAQANFDPRSANSAYRLQGPNTKLNQSIVSVMGLLSLSVITLLFAMLAYTWLPSMGVETLSEMLSAGHLFALIILAVGAIAYVKYLTVTARHPSRYLLAYLMLLPWFTWFTRVSPTFGLNIPQSFALGFLMCIPVFFLVWKYTVPMLYQVPGLRYYAIFWCIGLVNILFFDHPVRDVTALADKQTMSVHDFTTVTLTLVSLFLTVYALYREHRNHLLKFLDQLTWVCAISLSVYSALAVFGYPLRLFTVKVEGVLRMGLIFFHPNQFGMNLVFLMLFVLGMYFYQISQRPNGKLKHVLLGALILAFPALLTTYSKNAIGSFVICGSLLTFLNFKQVPNKRTFLMVLCALPVLAAGAIFAFEQFSGLDLIERLLFRFEDSRSMDWRWNTWSYIFNDIDASTVLFGHGFSATAERMDQFSQVLKAGSIMKVLQVHNDYLMLLYDFGVVGLIVYAWLILTMIKKGLSVIKTASGDLCRSLDVTLFSIILACLIFSATDNCYYMLETPFWILTMALWVLSDRLNDRQQNDRRRSGRDTPSSQEGLPQERIARARLV